MGGSQDKGQRAAVPVKRHFEAELEQRNNTQRPDVTEDGEDGKGLSFCILPRYGKCTNLKYRASWRHVFGNLESIEGLLQKY